MYFFIIVINMFINLVVLNYINLLFFEVEIKVLVGWFFLEVVREKSFYVFFLVLVVVGIVSYC